MPHSAASTTKASARWHWTRFMSTPAERAGAATASARVARLHLVGGALNRLAKGHRRRDERDRLERRPGADDDDRAVVEDPPAHRLFDADALELGEIELGG